MDWANKTSLTPLLFTEVPVPSKNRIMYLFVRGINFAFVYDFSSGFWNCSYSVVFFVFHFIKSYQNREKIYKSMHIPDSFPYVWSIDGR